MNGILEAALEVEKKLRSVNLQFCFIGGIALQRWGQPRMTLDVDVTVMAEFGKEQPIVTQLLELFDPRIDDAAEFALQSRVVLLRTPSHVGIDASLGGLPYEARMMDRSSRWEIQPGLSLTTCSAEDLIVQKVFAGREQDWVDVRMIASRQGKKLDRQLIERELKPLLVLAETPESMDRLEEILNEEAGA